MEETFDLGNVFLVVNDYETILEGIGEIEELSDNYHNVEYTYTIILINI